MDHFSEWWEPLPQSFSAVRYHSAKKENGRTLQIFVYFWIPKFTNLSRLNSWLCCSCGFFSNNLALGAAYGTAKSGTGIAAMSVMRPELIMKSIIPVVMAGIIAIYGLVVAVLIAGALEEPSKYTLYKWVAFFRDFSQLHFESCDHRKKINDPLPIYILTYSFNPYTLYNSEQTQRET